MNATVLIVTSAIVVGMTVLGYLIAFAPAFAPAIARHIRASFRDLRNAKGREFWALLLLSMASVVLIVGFVLSIVLGE